MLAHTVGDDADAAVVIADLGGQQQVTDEVGTGAYVHGRGLDRNQQQIFGAYAADQIGGADAALGIDHHALRVARHAHLPGTGQRRPAGVVAVDAGDARRIRRPRLEPAQAGTLRIVVQQRGAVAARGIAGGDIGRDGGFATTALGIEHDDSTHR